MKLDRLDVHDRLDHFKKNTFEIGECCQNLIDQRPFGETPFYIFAHARTDDDGVTKRLIWQPRLTKPKAQTNSMLFKAYPGSDNLKVLWMIPAREMWPQFKRGNIFESQVIHNSIEDFEKDRIKLERREDDDLNDEQINQIYRQLSIDSKRRSYESSLVQASLDLPQLKILQPSQSGS